jgi:hypothetical protein
MQSSPLQTAVQIRKQISSSVSWERPFRAFDIAQFISQIVHGMGALGISVRLLQPIHFEAGIRIW